MHPHVPLEVSRYFLYLLSSTSGDSIRHARNGSMLDGSTRLVEVGSMYPARSSRDTVIPVWRYRTGPIWSGSLMLSNGSSTGLTESSRSDPIRTAWIIQRTGLTNWFDSIWTAPIIHRLRTRLAKHLWPRICHASWTHQFATSSTPYMPRQQSQPIILCHANTSGVRYKPPCQLIQPTTGSHFSGDRRRVRYISGVGLA